MRFTCICLLVFGVVFAAQKIGGNDNGVFYALKAISISNAFSHLGELTTKTMNNEVNVIKNKYFMITLEHDE